MDPIRIAPPGSKLPPLSSRLQMRMESLNELGGEARDIFHSLLETRAPDKVQKSMAKVCRQIALTRYLMEIAIREAE